MIEMVDMKCRKCHEVSLGVELGGIMDAPLRGENG